MKVSQDHLVFFINFGAGGDLPDLVTYQLIWNGEYYFTDDLHTVDLALSFKDLDMGRDFIHKNISLDLLPLQATDTKFLYINF